MLYAQQGHVICRMPTETTLCLISLDLTISWHCKQPTLLTWTQQCEGLEGMENPFDTSASHMQYFTLPCPWVLCKCSLRLVTHSMPVAKRAWTNLFIEWSTSLIFCVGRLRAHVQIYPFFAHRQLRSAHKGSCDRPKSGLRLRKDWTNIWLAHQGDEELTMSQMLGFLRKIFKTPIQYIGFHCHSPIPEAGQCQRTVSEWL